MHVQYTLRIADTLGIGRYSEVDRFSEGSLLEVLLYK